MKENRTLEFKREVSDTFLKTVSAFANYTGGDIVFGVDDNGDICGIRDMDGTCLKIENLINDLVRPCPDYTLFPENSKGIITLTVRKGAYTPYVYRNRAYKRNDTSSVEVDSLELKRLILSGENRTFEELASADQDLEFFYLEKKLRDRLMLDSFSMDTLKTLGLYANGKGFSNAAAILSDQNDFPGIDIVRFGRTINIILDRESFKGMSALEMYDKTVGIFEKYYSYEEIDGMSREERFIVPKDAFREALANALAHRTWDMDANIRISMFDDRIEIRSPGGLPPGITEKEYLEGQVSVFRNPVIGNVFYRLGMIESFGTGILRIKDAYRDGPGKPAFNVYDNSIYVMLPVKDRVTAMSTDEEKIYETIGKGRILMSSQIAGATGFSKGKTIQLLHSLQEKDLIKASGNGRGTKYSQNS